MTEGAGIISTLLAIPVIGAILLMLVPETYGKAIKAGAVLFTGVAFIASLGMLTQFLNSTFHFQFIEDYPWFAQFGIHYRVGIDGISVWMVMLTTLLTFLSTIFSFYVKKRVKTYFIMMLLLETAMIGVFSALDLVLFYTFFEFSLIPMALMIAIWGGENRKYAAIKFFLYTFAASIFMLVGIIAVAFLNRDATGELTFNLLAIQESAATGALWANALTLQPILFWAFALGFMVKCPMFPFHTWLPDAHTEAPTAGSVILAGVLLKMGTYGFLRFLFPLFPDVMSGQVPVFFGMTAPLVFSSLAVIGIIYGAIVATMQTDIKRLVAYSSVAHMGFVVLGLFSMTHTGIMGGAYQQLNHGISTGALFLLIGLLYERIHTRLFKDMGGLKAQMPIFAALFLIVMLSSVGLPPLNGFIGEFLALMGSFQAGTANLYGLNMALPILAATGVIFAAVYLLWMFQKTFYGKITNPDLTRLKDLKVWEIGLVGVFVLFIFWGGLVPTTFFRPMERSVEALGMMSTNAIGARPIWNDPYMDIDEEGQLVRMSEPLLGTEGGARVSEVIAGPHYNAAVDIPPEIVGADHPDAAGLVQSEGQ